MMQKIFSDAHYSQTANELSKFKSYFLVLSFNRAMGVGLATTTARVSAILTPLVLLLSDTWAPLPLLIFGGSALLAGITTLFLPETVGKHLPETLEEAEIMASKFTGL